MRFVAFVFVCLSRWQTYSAYIAGLSDLYVLTFVKTPIFRRSFYPPTKAFALRAKEFYVQHYSTVVTFLLLFYTVSTWAIFTKIRPPIVPLCSSNFTWGETKSLCLVFLKKSASVFGDSRTLKTLEKLDITTHTKKEKSYKSVDRTGNTEMTSGLDASFKHKVDYFIF